MKYFTSEVKIALVAVVGLVVLFFGMQFLKGLSIFSSENTYSIRFSNISGLSASSPVYADGYKVGTVKAINYDFEANDGILVTVGLSKDLRIPKGSSAEIESDMMGNVKMNLLLANNPREAVPVGGVIQGDMAKGALDMATNLIPQVERILPKLDSIMASLNTLLADPAIAQSLHNVQSVTSDLTTSTKQLNNLLATVNGTMPSLLRHTDNTLANAEEMTGNLKQLNVGETLQKVNTTLDEANRFAASLNNTDGTLGLLLNDKALYNNLNGTMRSADSLLVDLKAHPKRYVHFSLFGRKDK